MIEVKKLEAIQAESVKLATIRIVSGVILSPGIHAEPGELWEVPRHFATMLVSYGQAELVQADEDPGSYGVRVEVPTTRDPKPKRK